MSSKLEKKLAKQEKAPKQKEADERFAETIYDPRYKKSKHSEEASKKYVLKGSTIGKSSRAQGLENEFDEPERVKAPKRKGMFVWNEESSEEESIDLEKINQLIGDDELNQSSEDAWSDEQDPQNLKNAPNCDISSKRLALMNYDWSKIKAGDLMIAFSSFLPEGGQLVRVRVFPSEFGKQRIAQEEAEGPGDIFKPQSAENQPEEGGEVQEKPKDKQGKKQKKGETQAAETGKPTKGRTRETEVHDWVVSAENPSAFDLHKLRKYERDRLKYYYAVLDFDSAATADSVLEACNGFELEKTGIKIGKSSLSKPQICE